MKKIIISLIILVILAFGGLSVYVSLIDWNQHKSQISAQVEKLTGKRVVFDGPVSLSFFPRPHLTASNIKIYNQNTQNGATGNVPLAVIQDLVTELSLPPLLHGNFEIDKMTLLNARILVEFLPNGRLNWHSDISDFQRESLGGMEIALNSVLLKNATVEIVNPGLDVDITLQSLTAEVTAQSLYGPYRIDGNFVKDGKPAGFALNLGTLTESFGTSITLALTHPTTESSARFDGQVLSNYAEIEGNLSIESKNLAKFTNDLTDQVIVPTDFDYPFLGSTEIKVNQQQLELNNLAIKYGDNTAGSGHLLIPLKLKEDEKKKTIEFAFELTDLDLMPVLGILKQQLKKYDNAKTYQPDFEYDLLADIKAIKATCRDGLIRNFALSFDFINDILNIKTLSGLLPGDTDFLAEGDVFENEKVLSYDFRINTNSQDVLKLLDWLGMKPQTYAPSTYRGSQISTRLSGNLNQIKIAPLSVTLDNNSATGILGIVRDQKTKIFLSFKSDKINFDNYLPRFTDEEMKKPLPERIKMMLNRLKFLNNYDVQLDAGLAMGIYQNTPFDNIILKFSSQNGTVKIDTFSVDNVASASINLTGLLSGLGSNPSVQNLKYTVSTDDFTSVRTKFDLPVPSWPLIKNAKKMQADGIMTGNLDLINIKAITNLDDSFFKSVYSGQLFNQNDTFNFKGRLEFNTDFIKFLNAVNLNYRPKDIASGILTFKGIVSGTPSDWAVSDLDAFISANNYKGNFSVSYPNGRPTINANIWASRFEFDRLFYNPGAKHQPQIRRADEITSFLKQPIFDDTNINYDFYKTFDLRAKFSTKALDYDTYEWTDVSADINVGSEKITVSGLKGMINRGLARKTPMSANFTIDLSSDPRIRGNLRIDDYEIEHLGGQTYALTSGILNAQAEYEAPIHSVLGFAEGLNGKLSFDIQNPVLEGWNLSAVEKDLATRDRSDKLEETLKSLFEKGKTSFDLIGAEIKFEKGTYTLSDALFSAKNESLDLTGSGRLATWDTDLAFRLIFEKLKTPVPPITVKWTGSLAHPSVSLDLGELKNKYDSYWDKIATDQKTAEENRLKRLKEAMNNTQLTIADLQKQIKDVIKPTLNKYAPMSTNAGIKSIYDSRHILLIDVSNQLDLMAEKASEDYTMDEIREMDARLETLDSQLAEIERDLNNTAIDNYQSMAEEKFRQIKDIHENIQNKSMNYQKTLDAYVMRLMQLNSLVVLDQDPKAIDYKNDVKRLFRQAEDLNLEAVQIHEKISTVRNLDEQEKFHTALTEIEQKCKTTLEDLNKALENLFSYATTLVREEEKHALEIGRTTIENHEAPLPAVEETVEETGNISEEPSETTENIQPEETPSPTPIPETETQEISEDAPSAVTETIEQPVRKLVVPVESSENGIISYSSKAHSSGSVSKGLKISDESASTQQPTNETQPLLIKPQNDEVISTGGTITRKK